MVNQPDEFDDQPVLKRSRKNDDIQDTQNNLCRDFIRSVCDRGAACKYKHEPSLKQRLSFCHDFQNGYCYRNNNCKFIHSSYEDEKYYLKTGQLPPHLLNWFDNQHRSSPPNTRAPYSKNVFYNDFWDENCDFRHVPQNELSEVRSLPLLNTQERNVCEIQVIPYCQSYMWGECWDSNCKFSHVTRSDYCRAEGRSPNPPHNHPNENISCDKQNVGNFDEEIKFRDTCYESEIKRTYVIENSRMDNIDSSGFDNNISYQNRSQTERSYIMLEEENIMLRERITELKKRIDDLQVTNEFLLEQNARFRLQQDKNTRLTAVTVPAVTITNSLPGANQMQPNPTPQQMVTAALRTVANVTVPVSISTVTPVSLSAVSMAPVQQMQGSVMTIAQGSASGQPLPMSISAPVPLVSYPIVSRPVIQQAAPPNLR